MTCTKTNDCKVAKGQRHDPECPWYGRHRSGKGGKTLSPRVQVSEDRIERIRDLYGVREEATPNEVLDGVIASKNGG